MFTRPLMDLKKHFYVLMAVLFVAVEVGVFAAPATRPTERPDRDTKVPAEPESLEPASDPPTEPESPKPAASVTRHAAAFPVGPDLFITTRAAVERADSITLEDAENNTFTAAVVRTDEKTGLALLKVAGGRFAFLNLARQFAGGTDVRCTSFPKASVFAPVPESIAGKAAPIKPGDSGAWSVSLKSNPRLGGAPLVTGKGELVGIVMAPRDSALTHIPAVRLDDLKAFLADDAPKAASSGDPNYVLMLTATVSK